MPAGTWWGVGRYKGRRPRTVTGHGVLLWKGKYPFGCNARPQTRSRHMGLDIGNIPGSPLYAWADGYVIATGYDAGGYHRWLQVVFPSVNWSLTLGHLLNGSQVRVGTRFQRGQYLARIGTKRDGLTYPHVHYRSAPGRWRRCITPCASVPPIRLWNRLN